MAEHEQPLPNETLAQLREQLQHHFSLDELKTLCFDLGIDSDSFAGSGGKTAFARELLEQLVREDKLTELLQKCEALRPAIAWRKVEPEGRSERRRPVKAASRVCFISSEYPPHVLGGLGVHVTQLTAALADHLDVHVVLPSPPDKAGYQSSSPRIKLYALAKSDPSYDDPLSWLPFAKQVADRITRIARESPPDVIHCHDWVTALAGIKCRWQLNVPLVFHLHLPNRNELCGQIENLGLVCADVVTINSEAMYEELDDRDLPIRRRETIKNGVDLETFVPCQDWPADDGYILFVGRLVDQKGVEYLLRALYFVKEKFPDIRLKIVGDGELRSTLERLCTNLMLSGQVEFLGWKTGPELVECYQKAAVVAVPSIYEPFGMTALEALACQRPVVASRVGGLKEIIKHGQTGFLAEPKDDLDLAQWLLTLLSSPDTRHDLGRAGAQSVQSEGYTWSDIAQRFRQLYDELLAEPPEKSFPEEAEAFKKEVYRLVGEMLPDTTQRDAQEKVLDYLFRGVGGR